MIAPTTNGPPIERPPARMTFPRAMLFDIGDTLVGPRQDFGTVYREEFEALGVLPGATRVEDAMRLAWQRRSLGHRPGLDRYALVDGSDEAFWRAFVGDVLREVRGGAPPDSLVATATTRLRARFASPAAWEVFEDVIPALVGLRAAGVRLAVVSNWDGRLPVLLDRLGLAPYFDALAVSHLERCEKPHPALFHRALERLGVAARDAMHIGDVPELDFAGAKLAGCAARLIDRRGRLAPGWRAPRTLDGVLRGS